MYNITIDGYNDLNGMFYSTGTYYIGMVCGDATAAPSTVPSTVSVATSTNAPITPTPTPNAAVTTAPSRQSSEPTARPFAVRSRAPSALDASSSSSSTSGGGGAVTTVVIVLLIAILIAGLLYWRHSRNSGSRSFGKMNHNPSFAPDRLLDTYDDDGEEDVFSQKRRVGNTPTLSDDW
jgi:hypothetical protein